MSFISLLFCKYLSNSDPLSFFFFFFVVFFIFVFIFFLSFSSSGRPEQCFRPKTASTASGKGTP